MNPKPTPSDRLLQQMYISSPDSVTKWDPSVPIPEPLEAIPHSNLYAAGDDLHLSLNI